ncbi:hypothetical protein [Komagataeibacter saccharivorans]|uniref:hypothetical protein n=1 Tax=Komagataeibacter saccharivorans TaxID=265959 RepID=UPI0039E87818
MAGSDGVPRPPSCSGTIRFMAGSHQTLQAIRHACLLAPLVMLEKKELSSL